MHDCQRDSHATSPTAIYANITQTGRIRVYCSWFWVVLAGFGWFRVLVTTQYFQSVTTRANVSSERISSFSRNRATTSVEE